MDTIIGTCSECGGPVMLPETHAGMRPPVPMCRDCKATPTNPYGPIIDMEKKKDITKILDKTKVWKHNRGKNDPRPMFKTGSFIGGINIKEL